MQLLSVVLQGTREVEGLVFSMVSDLGKLKRKVDLLGSAKDTMSHRCEQAAAQLALHSRAVSVLSSQASASSDHTTYGALVPDCAGHCSW